MLDRQSVIQYRVAAGVPVAPLVGRVGTFADETDESRSERAAEHAIDEVLADSFPASDPPSWNPGIARPDPRMAVESWAEGIADAGARTGVSYAIDVSGRTAERTFLQGVTSLMGGASLALLVPIAVLLVGLPIALSVRGVLELVEWLFGVSAR